MDQVDNMAVDKDIEKSNGDLAFNANQFAEAASHYEKTIELGNNDVNVIELLAFSYMMLKQYDKAKAMAHKAIDTGKASKKRSCWMVILMFSASRTKIAKMQKKDIIRICFPAFYFVYVNIVYVNMHIYT